MSETCEIATNEINESSWTKEQYISLIQDTKEAHQKSVDTFFDSCAEELIGIAQHCAQALRNGHKIMLCGNGGSAADAQHIAAEFVGRFKDERIPLASIALTTDTSALTCIGNDYGYDEVFSRQVKGIGQAGDVLIAISTSGNSENVIRAINAARENDISIVTAIGKSGGKMTKSGDFTLHVPCDVTAHIQECHIMALHMLCDMIEKELGF